MQFFAFNLENFTPDRIFHTGAACGACYKYEVWVCAETSHCSPELSPTQADPINWILADQIFASTDYWQFRYLHQLNIGWPDICIISTPDDACATGCRDPTKKWTTSIAVNPNCYSSQIDVGHNSGWWDIVSQITLLTIVSLPEQTTKSPNSMCFKQSCHLDGLFLCLCHMGGDLLTVQLYKASFWCHFFCIF